MKKWVVPRSEDPNSLAVIGASFRPKDAIAEAPIDKITGKPEDAEWLTVVNQQNPNKGAGEKKVVVDTALKKQILDQRQAQKAAADQARSERLLEVARLFQRADTFDKKQLVTIEEIQDAIADIVQVLRLLTENDRPKQ